MEDNTEYIEYDETFNVKLERKAGLTQRVKYRLQVRKNEIPYFSKGVDLTEFSYKDPTSSVKAVLKDITTNVDVDLDRITAIDVGISLPTSIINQS